MHVGVGLRMRKFQELEQQRPSNYSRAQELRCAHADFGESRCLVRVACFLQYDLGEAHLLHQESEWLRFDNGNEKSGHYLCQTI